MARQSLAKTICRLWCKRLHTMWNWFNTNHCIRRQSNRRTRYRQLAVQHHHRAFLPVQRQLHDYLGHQQRQHQYHQQHDHRQLHHHGGTVSRQHHFTSRDIIHQSIHHVNQLHSVKKNQNRLRIQQNIQDQFDQHRLVIYRYWVFPAIHISITICTEGKRLRWKKSVIKFVDSVQSNAKWYFAIFTFLHRQSIFTSITGRFVARHWKWIIRIAGQIRHWQRECIPKNLWRFLWTHSLQCIDWFANRQKTYSTHKTVRFVPHVLRPAETWSKTVEFARLFGKFVVTSIKYDWF